MGCRIYWGKVYKIEWEGGWFNWNAEQLRDCLRELGVEIWWQLNEDDDYTDFEISIEEWKKFRDKLRTIPKGDREAPVLGDDYNGDHDRGLITYQGLIDWAKYVSNTYDSDNDYIKFSWI